MTDHPCPACGFHKTNMMEVLSYNVRALAIDKGITLSDLALRAGTHLHRLNNLVDSRGTVTLALLERLATVLGTTPAALLTPTIKEL